MNPETFCDLIFHHMPCSAVTCKLLSGDHGNFEDFAVTAINDYLRGLLNMDTNPWIGIRASEYVEGRIVRHWTDRFETAVRTGSVGHYEEYAETLKRNCTVTIIPIKEDECTVMFVMN